MVEKLDLGRLMLNLKVSLPKCLIDLDLQFVEYA